MAIGEKATPEGSVSAYVLTTFLNWEIKVKSTVTKPKISSEAAPIDTSEKSSLPDAEDRLNHIATAAYYSAEARGFEPGRELHDWLQAEAKFD